MKNTSCISAYRFVIITASTVFMFSSCNSKRGHEEKEEKIYAERDESDSMIVAAAVKEQMSADTIKDKEQVFIRTADLQFSVSDVRKATEEIEYAVGRFNGFITYSGLNSTKVYENNIRISRDSVTKEEQISVKGEIMLRVPNENLDSMLATINKLANFMDMRTVRADDVKLQLLAAKRSAKRSELYIKKVNTVIDQQGKKLPQTVQAIETLQRKKEDQDAQAINLLNLSNQVNYSTVRLNLYQTTKTAFTTSTYLPLIEPYVPSFGDKLETAYADGLAVMAAIILFLVKIWPLLVIGGSIYVGVRLVQKRKISHRTPGGE